ncbi:MAG: response regulator transcription factor [Deltaproteobacteria bacterium]|jgi:DNA-binding response OmpR family regulator|nr:response regulator transcription factor [Deltaproteobacteria bacterium]
MIHRNETDHSVILVVDDDEDIVQTLKGNLELDGHEVLCAYNGRSGVEMTEKHRPALIILDLNLPDIDGVKACKTIRNSFDFPIIMLTARDGVSDKVLGLECGADDYMIKPFHYLELSARIKAILRRVDKKPASPSLVNGGLCIDLKSRTVTLEGRIIKLTRTEFKLLELFSSHPNEVLSRDFITQQIWRDSQLYHNSRAVDVHVQRLRKKLEPDIEHPSVIVTVAGVGYKLEMP